MIYTSYFAKLKSLPVNIIPISICGKAPDWYKGLQYKKLAPKYDFFMEWKKNHDNDYYIKCFNEQVLEELSFVRVNNDLQLLIPYDIRCKMQHNVAYSPDWHIALICYEKPSDFCHRHLVADWLNKNGIPCEEWGRTMKIIKEPNLSLTCPVCGCEFEFDKNDVYNATGGMRKDIPKNPHKAVCCPICDKSISVWNTEVKDE